MLRVSKMADYGTVVMVFLARAGDRVYNAKEIAENIHLTVPTVSKLLKLLAGSGLLQSVRGAKGGYSLARAAEDISVADIIQAVEGSSGLTECALEEGECALEAVCQISDNWQLINTAIQSALASVALSELAKPKMQITSVNVSDITKITEQEESTEL